MIRELFECRRCKRKLRYLIDGFCHACTYGCEPDQIKCINCGNIAKHHAKCMCKRCYDYKGTRKITCPQCGKVKHHRAKGLCSNCFTKTYHYDKIKASNTRRYHNLSFDYYNKLTESCTICSFSTIVELHHIDHNHKNNKTENLIGLCPNHHRMIHNEQFAKEVIEELQKYLKSKNQV